MNNIIINKNFPDNASCPECKHYNAMLPDGGVQYKCRDCGAVAFVVHKKMGIFELGSVYKAVAEVNFDCDSCGVGEALDECRACDRPICDMCEVEGDCSLCAGFQPSDIVRESIIDAFKTQGVIL